MKYLRGENFPFPDQGLKRVKVYMSEQTFPFHLREARKRKTKQLKNLHVTEAHIHIYTLMYLMAICKPTGQIEKIYFSNKFQLCSYLQGG